MKRSNRKNEDYIENSWGGYQYRWNYDEYQKDLQNKRKKYAARGMRAFCLTAVFVFVLCFASLAGVLSVAFVRGPHSGQQNNGKTDLSIEKDSHSLSDEPISGLLPVDTEEDDGTSADTEELPTHTTPLYPVASEDISEDAVTDEPAVPETDVPVETDTGVETLDDDYAQKVMPDEIAQKTYPSVVSLHFGDTSVLSAGNGFFLSDDGYLVTAYHILQTDAPCFVRTETGIVYDAELISFDTVFDLALLKIEAVGTLAVVLGSSERIAAGDTVIAVERTVDGDASSLFVSGHVFGKERIPRGDADVTDDPCTEDDYTDVLLSSAHADRCVSGSPLLNDASEVIGINVCTMTGEYDGKRLCSIPIDPVTALLHGWMRDHRDTLQNPDTDEEASDTEVPLPDTEIVTDTDEQLHEPVQDPVVVPVPIVGRDLGILVAPVTNEEAVLYKIPVGILVCHIEPGSYAESNLIQKGDIILAVNGVKVQSTEEFDACFSSVYVTDTVQLEVFRRGLIQTLTLIFDDVTDEETSVTETVANDTEKAA